MSASTSPPLPLEDSAESNGRTPGSDLIVGIAMIVLSIACALAYTFILQAYYEQLKIYNSLAIIRDAELIRMTSYRFMVVLGICDVVQCLPHAITGVLTITQPEDEYTLKKILGVLATPFYVGYAAMTVILSLQRFVQLANPRLHDALFSKRSNYWIVATALLVLLYMIALGSPWAAIIYDPEWYSWDYDRTRSLSWLVEEIEMYIEVGGIFVSGILYGGVFILLIRTRRRFATTRSYTMEVKILIQALTITVYCSILNIFWHNYQVLLPANLWSYCALNFMWILNSGVYPVVYFVVNSVIRGKLSKTATRSIAPLATRFTTTAYPTDRRLLGVSVVARLT